MTMLIAAAGVAILFLGRELSFLVSGIMAMLIGLRLVPLLPAGWPPWADLAFILGLGALGVFITLLDKRAGYYVTGFLLGGFIVCRGRVADHGTADCRRGSDGVEPAGFSLRQPGCRPAAMRAV